MLTATRTSVKQLRTWKRMVGVSTPIGLLTSDEAPTSTITCCLKEASEWDKLTLNPASFSVGSKVKIAVTLYLLR
jgi:hypothetical protein